ncbi:coatomer epsilon subunit [Schizosaccharomyces japonicus yFS275]|uniref:Coatomer epsilon subunit n=1 Tax=Schizosaccharomyces japonicus (strain yFS275 / FY16936) TaxID=402676 RepID=B6K1X1_SCHJY|nr:coatomer epsilon subunit [Schizosaccharomyces japonicus yFS275]EEB07152.1 coatomer epsilon subunit [Schizosaccharomyces japonicus yFS275]
MFSYESGLYNELYFVRQYFYSGSYSKLFEIDASSMSEGGKELTEIYFARAKRIQGASLEEIKACMTVDTPGTRAMLAYAGEGDLSSIVAEHGSSDGAVQVLGALSLIQDGQLQVAYGLLEQAEENLEAVALQVYICLAQGDITAAETLVHSALDWTDEEIVLQIAHAWVKLARGGYEAYNDVFYVFEEISSSSASAFTRNYLAIADLCLCRAEDAVAHVENNANIDEGDNAVQAAVTSANAAVAGQHTGKQRGPASCSLASVQKALALKSAEFDALCESFAA